MSDTIQIERPSEKREATNKKEKVEYDRAVKKAQEDHKREEEALKKQTCFKCGKHKASLRWVGDGGFMAFSHGMWQPCCDCCAAQMVLDYAKERASKIPELEKELTEAQRGCK